jgi:coenzyme F420-reducing hydrogenase delta subunit
MIYHGLETLHKAQNTNPELMAEAMIKKAKIRNLNLSTAETKELVANPKEVAQQLLELVEPKAKISKEDLGNVG